MCCEAPLRRCVKVLFLPELLMKCFQAMRVCMHVGSNYDAVFKAQTSARF